jgi:zinc-ribbon family
MGMLIIFGFRRRASRLAVIFTMCSFCHTPAAHAVTRLRKFFTLFFIPVIPIGTKYTTTCTLCGRSALISKDTADKLVAFAQQADGASAGPSGMPMSPINGQEAQGTASAIDTSSSAPGEPSSTPAD